MWSVPSLLRIVSPRLWVIVSSLLGTVPAARLLVTVVMSRGVVVMSRRVVVMTGRVVMLVVKCWIVTRRHV